MRINWTFGRRLALGFAIAVFALLVIGISGYRSTDHLIENDRWVTHTHEVRTKLADLVSSLKDAETGQRGFVITGDDGFLDPYRGALPDVARTISELRALTSDNETQQHPARDIATAGRPQASGARPHDRAAPEPGVRGDAEVVAAGEGKILMDQMRRVISDMDGDEAALLQQRSVEAERSAENTKSVILWGSLFGMTLVAAGGALISRSLASQLGAAVHHIQTSSTELQSAANQQATGAREQASAMSEISTTISELLATSRQIAESARRVSEIADQTATAARSGDQTVDKGRESIAGIRRQVDAIVHHMLDLGKKSQQNRGGARDRVGAGGADQHPRHQRDDRGGRRGRCGAPLWRRSRRDPQIGRSRRRLDQGDPDLD